MCDLFQKFNEMESVKMVRNFYNQSASWINFIFYLCPKMNGSGVKINELGTGFTTRYVDGLTASALGRIDRVITFQEEYFASGYQGSFTGIWCDADALILFPIAAIPPDKHMLIDRRFMWASNYDIVRNNYLESFYSLYREKPWENIPAKIRIEEEERLRALLPSKSSDNLIDDFIRRTFAGFALDGLILKTDDIVSNSIILGVESPGIPMLQNAALKKEDRIPVVELY